jgi:hypothetical protein
MLYVKLSGLLTLGCLLVFTAELVGAELVEQEKSLFNGKEPP